MYINPNLLVKSIVFQYILSINKLHDINKKLTAYCLYHTTNRHELKSGLSTIQSLY